MDAPEPGGADDAWRALERALRDPAGRARLAQSLQPLAPVPWWERYRQFIAGLASGAVVLLAFLVPSLQDQWDRHESRAAIERYAAIGDRLMAAGLHGAAEDAFGKALELSEGRRVDLLERQLIARVARVNDDPAWRGVVPDDLSEADFVYLLELQQGAARAHARADTLAALGNFLASRGRGADAEARVREAVALDPRNVPARVALGNLLADAGRTSAAEAEYRQALALAPGDANATYDLVALLADAGRCAEAAAAVAAATAVEPATRELAAACRPARRT